MTEFGCGYCADDHNRLYGHVPQIASNAAIGMILIECPKCSTLYTNTPNGPDQTRRITEVEAAELFLGCRPPRRS